MNLEQIKTKALQSEQELENLEYLEKLADLHCQSTEDLIKEYKHE